MYESHLFKTIQLVSQFVFYEPFVKGLYEVLAEPELVQKFRGLNYNYTAFVRRACSYGLKEKNLWALPRVRARLNVLLLIALSYRIFSILTMQP